MRKISTNSNAKELDPAKLAELKKNAALILDVCRRNILNRSPFFGQVMMQLDIVPVRDLQCATACTDGRSIFFDIDFLSQLSDADREFVLEHELIHNILIHLTRLEGRDPNIFNIATDCEVNELLRTDGLTVPTHALLPEKYDMPTGLSAEEYYDILIKKLQNKSQSNGDGDGEDGNSQSNGNGSMSAKNRLTGQFDKHVYEGLNEEPADGNENVEDQYGKVSKDSDFRPQPTSNNAEKIREAAVSAAQQIAREHGSLPAHIERLVNKLVTPEVNWKEALSKFITRTAGESNRSWNRPNRRFVSRRLYLPTSSGEKIKIAVGIDTSGSTVMESSKFLSEVREIVASAGEYELTIVHCDSDVQKVEYYNSEENSFDPYVDEYNFAGGGGTDLRPIFTHLIDNSVDVDAIVMFTDGYFSPITREELPDIPVIWTITNGGSTDALPPDSEVIKFKNAS